jgi:hypothetical protein
VCFFGFLAPLKPELRFLVLDVVVYEAVVPDNAGYDRSSLFVLTVLFLIV